MRSFKRARRSDFCLEFRSKFLYLFPRNHKKRHFNIGHRIALTDFTFEEAKPLARGLDATEERGEQALRRILHWTGGHPYLTQKLCQIVVSDESANTWEEHIDQLVEKNLLSALARHDDSNLDFVRSWLSGSSEQSWDVLKLYRRICRGRAIKDASLSPIHNTLKLSGVVKPDIDRLLQIRNRIYQRVFTDHWAKEAMHAIQNRRVRKAAIERIGQYKIIHQLGRGAFGEVYLAEHEGLNRRVAIKIALPSSDGPEMLKRFQQEGQLLAHLDHPNIARLFDTGSLRDGRMYLVMEYIEGLPINEHCIVYQLPINQRLHIFLQVCEAMQYAHQRLILHRDLKPRNILVTKLGVVKLMDFGIAKQVVDSRQTAEHTLAGRVAFTPLYASPDQIRGEQIGIASDIYSLGVILYELITGKLPYKLPYKVDDLPVFEVMRAIIEVEPERPSSVVREAHSEKITGALDQIVLTALRKNPREWFVSIEKFAQAILQYLSSPSMSTNEVGIPSKIHRRNPKLRAILILGSLLLLLTLLWVLAIKQ